MKDSNEVAREGAMQAANQAWANDLWKAAFIAGGAFKRDNPRLDLFDEADARVARGASVDIASALDSRASALRERVRQLEDALRRMLAVCDESPGAGATADAFVAARALLSPKEQA